MTAATIGIDVGTSGVRVALVDAGGTLLGIRSALLAPSDRRNPRLLVASGAIGAGGAAGVSRFVTRALHRG